MSWTFAEERPIYWEEPPEQIAITNAETGERDFYMLTSSATKRILELEEYVSHLEARLGREECRNISPKLGNDEFTCEECLARVYGSGGRWFDVNREYHKFNYCPNCGRRIAE